MGLTTGPAPNNESLNVGLGSPQYLALLWTKLTTVAGFAALFSLILRIGSEWLPAASQPQFWLLAVAVFFAPSALFAWLAGYCADHFDKRTVLLAAKALDLLAIILAIAGMNSGSQPMLLMALATSGASKAFFDASCFALIGQWFDAARIMRANSLLWIGSWAAAVFGWLIAEQLHRTMGTAGLSQATLSAVVLTTLVLIGCVGILGLAHSTAVGPHEKFPWNPLRRTWLDLRSLAEQPALLRMAIGIVVFWSISTVALLSLARFAAESNGLSRELQIFLLMFLTIGVIVGNFFVGWASLGRVELGLVPWGALVAIIALFLLATSSRDSLTQWGTGNLSLRSQWGAVMLGWGAIVFCLPMVAYFQQHCYADVRGSRFAATNLLVGLAIPLCMWINLQAESSTQPGNFANLPPELQTTQLSPEGQAIVQSAVDTQLVSEARDPRKNLDAKFDELDQAVGRLVGPDQRATLGESFVEYDLSRRPVDAEQAVTYYRRKFPEVPVGRLEQVIRKVELRGRETSFPPNSSLGNVALRLVQAWDQWNRSRSLRQSWRRPIPQPNCLIVESVSNDIKRAGLARLLWSHLQARQTAGDVLSEREYLELFAGDREASLIVKHVLTQVARQPRLGARQVLLLLSLLSLPIFVYAVMRVPQAMARLPLWWAFQCLYRVRINGVENIPPNGGAVLVINHSTYIDGLIILLMSARRIRMIAWAGNFNSWIMRVLARFAQVILMTGGPKSIQKGLSEGRKALQHGELVGIFPEGGITRTGQVLEFRPGLMKMLEQLPVPIIPVYIDQIWGSIFSYAESKSIWKFPKTFRHRITINIGPRLWRPENMFQVRQAVLQQGAVAVYQRQPPFTCPGQMFVRACRKRRFKSKIADSTSQELTGGMLLTRSLILRDLLRKYVLADDEKIVGVLIPPSTGGVIANMALALDRRVAVHLNYTLSERLINECIKIADVKHVLTTRKIMEKFNFKLQAEVYYLDDLKDRVSKPMKMSALFRAFALPTGWLERQLGLRDVPPDEMLTVIFTSGSTGIPKGVMLSQRNIASNVEAIGQVICLNSKDTLIGVLPFFHSFGYTVTLWGGMGLDVRGVYHFSPLEANQIGKLAKTYHGTVLLGTPTFLRNYLRKCTRDDFATVNTVVAGAEKLPAELCVAFDHRFGVRPVEGYGTTELSPLVSVNVPASRSLKNFQPDSKEGTVGRPIPNVIAKITDLDDPKRELGPNQTGMLWIKGPNVMLGYMHRPDLTNEVILDGWYCTGDVAIIDNEGFITLTGRMSRFSKIGGEMIPHIQIEEALAAILSQSDSDEQQVAVTALPDPKRGERLIVLHTELNQSPAELCRRLRESGLPNLYIPSEDSFFKVDGIPVLGSGKLDLKRMKEVAAQVAGQAARP